MLTLIVRQSLKNGAVKTWKLHSANTTHTFGSSRLADVISISPDTHGIQGLFEFRNGNWWYIDMDPKKSATGAQSPALCLDSQKSVDLDDCSLEFTPVRKEQDLYLKLEQIGNAQRDLKGGKSFQLYIVEQAGKVLTTKVLPINKKLVLSEFVPPISVACQASDQWTYQNVGEIKIRQRTISLEDAQKLGSITADQLIDEDSKKGLYVVLGFAFFLLTVGIFAPKNQSLETVAAPPPKIAQKIVVKTELKPKRKKAEAPQKQVVVKEAPAPAPTKVAENNGSQSKVSKMLNSAAAGRISTLIGKVSAQAAKSGNVVIAQGVKAGSGAASGRALAAVGSMEKSGRDWSSEGSGQGVVISTAGRGGGKNASGMGGLAAGSTGSAGVGLIEDESEIVGGLDREIIAQYIKSQLGQILYCYERQLSASPDLFGKVAVKFTIGPSGSVEQQLIGDTTLKNATVEGCILNRVAAWKFPQPQGGTRVLVTYPFLFKSTN
ncbi:hypothetical protein BDW_05010 [Bdellovibrio bacteriovorus W]|nr:hypothetical protein BDW_05010 [Bdellovibrio bacteriovorus W]